MAKLFKLEIQLYVLACLIIFSNCNLKGIFKALHINIPEKQESKYLTEDYNVRLDNYVQDIQQVPKYFDCFREKTKVCLTECQTEFNCERQQGKNAEGKEEIKWVCDGELSLSHNLKFAVKLYDYCVKVCINQNYSCQINDTKPISEAWNKKDPFQHSMNEKSSLEKRIAIEDKKYNNGFNEETETLWKSNKILSAETYKFSKPLKVHKNDSMKQKINSVIDRLGLSINQ